MIVYLGSNELKKVYLGNTEIKKIYVGERRVYPKDRFTPNTNTLFRFPFENDQVDKINGATLSRTGTKTSLGYTFTGTTTYSRSYTTNCFVMCWVKMNSGYGGSSCCTQIIETYVGDMNINTSHTGSSTGRIQVGLTVDGTSSYYGVYPGFQNGKRFHVAYGIRNNNTPFAIVNGVKYNFGVVGTPRIGNPANQFLRQEGQTINATFFDMIGQDEPLSDEVILDYYNFTKSMFGY